MVIENGSDLRAAVVAVNEMRRKRPKVNDRIFAQAGADIVAEVASIAQAVEEWGRKYNAAVESLAQISPDISFREGTLAVNGPRAASAFRAEDGRILKIK